MNAKKIVVLVLLAGLGFAVFFIVAGYNDVERLAGSATYSKLDPTPTRTVSQPITKSETPIVKGGPVAKAPAAAVTKPIVAEATSAPVAQDQSVAQSTQTKEPIQDPEARLALSFVGADPDAEEYWVSAINDPSLGPEERKDLIEDLNEDGLSDPKHPGPEDVPLIVSRLQLIEELAPYAMDKVNADAFAEARKDLQNMLDGKPVQ